MTSLGDIMLSQLTAKPADYESIWGNDTEISCAYTLQHVRFSNNVNENILLIRRKLHFQYVIIINNLRQQR